MLVLGCIDNPFFGVRADIETGMGNHFTVSLDFTWGTQVDWTSVEFRPSINYYLAANRLEFFA